MQGLKVTKYETMPKEEIERILNDYDRLKRATDSLTAEDASLWSCHIVEWPPLYENECAAALANYARILSEEE